MDGFTILIVIVLAYLWWQSQRENEAGAGNPRNVDFGVDVPLEGPATLVLQSPAKMKVDVNGVMVLTKTNSDPKPLYAKIASLKSGDVIDVHVSKNPGEGKVIRGQIHWLGAVWPLNSTNLIVAGNVIGRVEKADPGESINYSSHSIDWKTDWIWNEFPEDDFHAQMRLPVSLGEIHNFDYEKI